VAGWLRPWAVTVDPVSWTPNIFNGDETEKWVKVIRAAKINAE
jgi:hypothetical protein